MLTAFAQRKTEGPLFPTLQKSIVMVTSQLRSSCVLRENHKETETHQLTDRGGGGVSAFLTRQVA